MKYAFSQSSRSLITATITLMLTACGGGGSSGGGNTAPTTAPVASLNIGLKQLQFSWPAVDGSDHYRLLQNPDGSSGFTVVSGADNITTTSHDLDIAVHKLDWVNAEYRVEACNADESTCLGSSNLTLSPADAISAIGYFKAFNTDPSDLFGQALAVSADGNTLALGAYVEDSNADGIDGDQADNTASGAGAVYIFVRNAGVWSQQAYIKASNSDANDYFAFTLALSADGNTLAVGAYSEESAATGIDGNQADNTAAATGAAYVFTRNAGSWSQQAYIKASNSELGDYFGYSIALSDDGDTLAVGAYGEDSSATGINGNQADNTATGSGAVYLYTRSADTWTQQAYIKASNTEGADGFGVSVALNDDGNTLAVGANGEDSAATGIDGNEADNSASLAGACYLFTRIASAWTQQAYIKASNTDAADYFGYSLSLSDDGNTLAVGAYGEDSSATGVDGSQSNNSTTDAGAAYLFTRSSTGIWSQQAYIKASNTQPDDRFATAVALSGDGNTLAAGAHNEDSAATGINGDQGNTASDAGAAYLFSRTSGLWTQKTYLKASNSEASDLFGFALALDAGGDNLAVGAYHESSAAIRVNGDQSDNTATRAGAVYLY